MSKEVLFPAGIVVRREEDGDEHYFIVLDGEDDLTQYHGDIVAIYRLRDQRQVSVTTYLQALPTEGERL